MKVNIPKQILDRLCEKTTKVMSLVQITSLKTIYKVKCIVVIDNIDNNSDFQSEEKISTAPAIWSLSLQKLVKINLIAWMAK